MDYYHAVIGHSDYPMIHSILFQPRRVLLKRESNDPVISATGYPITLEMSDDEKEKLIVTKWSTPSSVLDKLEDAKKQSINTIKNFINFQDAALVIIHPGQDDCRVAEGNHLHIVIGVRSELNDGLIPYTDKINRLVDQCGGYFHVNKINDMHNTLAYFKKDGRLFWGTNSTSLLTKWNKVDKFDGITNGVDCVLPDEEEYIFNKPTRFDSNYHKHMSICGELPFNVESELKPAKPLPTSSLLSTKKQDRIVGKRKTDKNRCMDQKPKLKKLCPVNPFNFYSDVGTITDTTPKLSLKKGSPSNPIIIDDEEDDEDGGNKLEIDSL